jgi:polycystin 1L2
LGNLNYLKIWHDNSGKGDKASWFLKYIIVRDMQTKEEFYFLCNDWLAVEHGDGKIERGLFIALDKQKTELKYLLEKQAKTYLNDNHLWLSVFTKPAQSPFTRLDRVTCCFVFHYLAMVLNILYYKASLGILPNPIKINLSIVNITMEQVKAEKEIHQFSSFIFLN